MNTSYGSGYSVQILNALCVHIISFFIYNYILQLLFCQIDHPETWPQSVSYLMEFVQSF